MTIDPGLLDDLARTTIESTSAAAADEVNPETASMSLDQIIRAYETALSANDTDTILGLYSAEPVFMPQGAPALVGRATVRAGCEHVFNTLKLNVGFADTLAGVAVATGDIVAADQDGVVVVPFDRIDAVVARRRPAATYATGS